MRKVPYELTTISRPPRLTHSLRRETEVRPKAQILNFTSHLTNPTKNRAPTRTILRLPDALGKTNDLRPADNAEAGQA